MTNSVDADPAELTRARTEAINLVQWLARIANSYASDGPLEQRTDLEFRTADAAFVTKSFGAGLALEMRLPSLELQFLENGKQMPHTFDPEEHSPTEVEAWLLVELLHRGVDRDKFSKILPYEIAGLRTGDAEDHSPQSCQQGLRQLTAWFQGAAVALETAARAAAGKNVRILCSPQTLTLRCASEPAGKQNDLHFSPGDGQSPEPYFYADRAATNGAVRNLRRPILKGSTLLAQSDPAAVARQLLELVSG
jgi:hypothetical protein